MIRPGDTFGRYAMLGLLGRGGMAEVYLAEPLDAPGTRVAVKRLLPHYADNRKFVSMMRDEARIATAIDHPNVARVFEFGTVDGTHFMAMEYVDGVDLGRVLRRLRAAGIPLPLPAALFVGASVAHGLEAAHGLRDADGHPSGVIHRDVSPHNVLVSHAGQVKLIDFGVAKARSNSTKTKSGVIKGKLQYMSPEQAQAKPVDARADVFSLGMTLYRMVAGRLPFTGQTDYQIYDQILRKPTPPPRHYVPDLPARVEAILLRSLRKDREARFPSAGAMAAVLGRALQEIEPGYGPPHLAALLAGVINEAAPGDDEDDDSSERDTPGRSGHTPVLEAFEVDRLTRVEEHPDGFVPTVRAEVAPPPPAGGLPVQAVQLPPTEAVRLPPTEAVRLPPTEAVVLAPARLPRVTADDLPATVVHRDDASSPSLSEPSRGAPVPSITELMSPGATRWRRAAAVLLAALLGTVVSLVYLRSRPNVGPARPKGQAVVTVGPGPSALPPIRVPDLPEVGPADAGVTDVGVPDAGVTDVGVPDAGQPDAAWPEPKVEARPAARRPPPRPVVRRRRARPAVKAPATAKGYLTANALPWAHVEVDGRRLKGHTPIVRAPLPAGAHRITFVSPTGERFQTRVTIKKGAEARVVHRFGR